MEKWHMDAIMGALPTILCVFLFFAGLLVLLWTLDPVISSICLAIVILMTAAYMATTILAVIYLNCPFQTPASQVSGIALSYLL
jgi:hypothetical protein